VIVLKNAAATDSFGRTLATVLRRGDVITLSGDLGAGKTSLARGLLAALGLADEAPSPSYSIVIPYHPPHTTLPIWHVDLYRIDAPADIEELGLDDALFDGALIIEWPERLGDRSWPETLQLALLVAEDGSRHLTAKLPPSWKDRWPFT
jgi:tRNA threonylcarbamoyladenosine biosynthesis protein TsaE